MEITKEMADALCKKVVCQLLSWETFPAVLQAGGIESRASSRFVCALEGWLRDEKQENLLVLPEYRLNATQSTDETTDSRVIQAVDMLLHGKRIDYALVQKNSIGQSRLQVDTVIEVKTNYLCQDAELKKRPEEASKQADGYARACSKKTAAYVLYVVASPVMPKKKVPDTPRDAGWGYFRDKHSTISTNGPLNLDGVQVVGKFFPDEEQLGNTQVRIWAYVLKKGKSQ